MEEPRPDQPDTPPEGPKPHQHTAPHRLNRRQFIGLTALGGAVAAGTVVIAERSSGSPKPGAKGHPAHSGSRPTETVGDVDGSGTQETKLADGVSIPTSSEIVAENAKVG